MLPIKMIVYGEPGTGKTVFLATALDVPALNPCLLLDLEGGSMSINSKCVAVDFQSLEKVTPNKINRLRIKTWKELEDAIDYLYSAKNVYKTVMLDSLTETNYINLSTVTKAAGRQDAAQIQDYGKSAAQMRKTVREFRNFDDINVFISCLANEDKDERTGILKVKPSLTGKLVGEIPALVDIVGFLHIDKDEVTRVMSFQPSGRYVAKDRTEGGALGDEIDDCSIPEIYKRIHGDSKT